MSRYLFLLLALAVIAGCSGDNSTDAGNNSEPTISFITNKIAVPKGVGVDLEVAVDDPDGDPLSVTWEVSPSGGSLDPADQGNPVMTWTPPASVGSHTIIATVTDGKESVSASIVLQTGTVWANDVLGSTSWSNANSPYIIRQDPGDLNFIISGSTLSIGPGVTVLIDTEEQEINVYGKLQLSGTQTLPVAIKPNRRNPAPGFWKGILVDVSGNPAGGELDFDYARISYAQYNIRTDVLARVALNNCTISHGSDAGIYFRSGGNLAVDNCRITQNGGSGIWAEKIAFDALNPAIQIFVTNSAIQYNGGSGVEIDHPDQYAALSTIEFSADSVAFNDFHGINILKGAYPKITNCAIFFNDIIRVNNGFNVRFDPAFTGLYGAIDARNNFWGSSYATADSMEIAALIYDRKDNSGLPRVNFVPWCNTHPCP